MVKPQEKGKRGEREVAKILNKIFGSDLKRTPNSGGLSIKGDIVVKRFKWFRIHKYHLEVKNRKNLAIPEWIRQARSDCGKKMPVVIFPLKHTYKIFNKPPITIKQWYVLTRIEDWANELRMNDENNKE